MIFRSGRTWEVRSEDGKKLLGKHPTYEEAVQQLRAVEVNKKRKKAPSKSKGK